MPIAFKEWAVTVRALAEGEQLLTLRKGGIREADKHFEIEHDRFFLYPTFDHQRNDLVRESHHPELRRALEEGLKPPFAVVAGGLCANLLELWPALWTFAVVDGVEPTNNAAERALRPAVLWRKGSFGSQSDDGCRFVERLLTVAATCKQQGRGLLDFLVQAITAARLGLPPPSLVPATPG